MPILPRWPHRNSVLILCILAYFAIRFSEFVISPVLPQIEAGLGISTSFIGVAFTGSTAAYALAQLPSGVLSDRFSERAVILAALGLTGIASTLLSFSPSGLLLIVAMTLLGVVSGSYYSPATALLSDLFEDTGRAIGIHRVGGQAVGFTAPLVAFVGVAYGWRAALLLGALVALPVFVGFRAVVGPQEPATSDAAIRERIEPGVLSELLSRPSIAYTTTLASLGQFADTATFSFLIAILQDYHGLSPELAGVLFTDTSQP
jgi:YNFM family putative membrane transporter